MRSFHKLFFAFTILLYTSCAEETPADNSPPAPAADSPSTQTVNVDSISHADSLTALAVTSRDTIATVLLEWEKELQSKGIKMRLDKFYAAGMSDVELDEGYEWDGVVEDWYVRSPDGRYYSYDVPSWGDGDADTYLHLIDVQKKRMYYVNVIGTCCTYMGTGWANDHTLIAIGYDTYEAEERYPNQRLTQGFYEVYDLNTMSKTFYCSKNFFRRPCSRCGPFTPVQK